MLRKFFPSFINRNLFGDREKYGPKPWPEDVDWLNWQKHWPEIYQKTQHNSYAQELINNAGYQILDKIDWENKVIAEIGPGAGEHYKRFKVVPDTYNFIDITDFYFEQHAEYFSSTATKVNNLFLTPEQVKIDLPSGSQDYLLSFYSLEHLYPLDEWLEEISRVLKKGGKLVGAIPTEGGVLWGACRWVSSRKVLEKEFNIDMLKIICWSHPNMCDEITKACDEKFIKQTLINWPCNLPNDISFVVKFIYQKP